MEKDRVTTITYIILSMCNSIYAWYNPKGKIKPEDLSEIIFKMLTEGVPASERKAKADGPIAAVLDRYHYGPPRGSFGVGHNRMIFQRFLRKRTF